MPEYYVSGTYGDTVEADNEVAAVDRALDKGGWSWEATPVEEAEITERHGAPLRLSFSPSAIREHFEADEPDPTEGLTDEQLAEVAYIALTDDGLYRAFHDALTWALGEV